MSDSQAGGLFIPAEAVVRAGNFVTIPPHQMDRSGTISVPYSDDVPAIGKSIPQLQYEIQQRLAARAIDHRVVVTLLNQRSSRVSVVGDASSPNTSDANPVGDRSLSGLAKANGIVHPGLSQFSAGAIARRSILMKSSQILTRKFSCGRGMLFTCIPKQKFVAFGEFGATGAAGASGSLNNLLDFACWRPL